MAPVTQNKQSTPRTRALRRSIAAAAAVLVIVAGAFLLVARLAGHRMHFNLPGRLGADISQTANGFTYSQSSKGHTLFTIHASKLVEYKADQARLHDVQITMYGPEGSSRIDRISGSDFLYDRKRGIATAQGGVEIEMASPTTPTTPTTPASGPGDRQPIHIRTASMSFDQNTSEATTADPVDFTLTRGAGHAVGASYNSKTGVLLLNAQVVLTSQRDAGVATVRAASAEFLRDSHMAFLRDASSEYTSEKSSADAATLHFRPDGSVEQIEAQGRVHVVMEDGSEIHAGKANIALDQASQPVKADMLEGVNYASNAAPAHGPGQSMHGNAVEGTLDFVGKGQLKHAQFRNAVSFVDQLQSAPGERYSSSTREMKASRVDVDFEVTPGAKSIAQTAVAQGEQNGSSQAVVVIHDLSAETHADKVTTIAADHLVAQLVDGHAIRQLDGQGRTKVVDATPDGAASTSTGDVLHAKFIVTAKGAPRPQGDSAIESAVQQGHVTILQQPARDARDANGQPQAPLHATARQAEFGGADQLLHLTGEPHVTNGSLDLTADLVDYHRDSGDASAHGNVKSTYVQAAAGPSAGPGAGSGAQQGRQKAAGPTLGGEGPVHIVSDRAEMKRADNLSFFYGSPTAPARMWQGEDSVAAPVLELSKQDQTLYAHGAAHDRGTVVHAALAQKQQPGTAPAVTRVQAETLHYYDRAASEEKAAGAAAAGPPDTAPGGLPWRRADFHGSVVAEETNGVIHSDDAHMYLTPEQPGKPSQLDHILATGHVVITQPGRRGVGDRLVYTAADTRYVLTGTPGAPPRVTDAEKGTTTGAALIFTSASDSVVVSGGVSGGASAKPARAVTDTHTQK